MTPSEIIDGRIEFWTEQRNAGKTYADYILQELTAIRPGIYLAEHGVSREVIEAVAHRKLHCESPIMEFSKPIIPDETVGMIKGGG